MLYCPHCRSESIELPLRYGSDGFYTCVRGHRYIAGGSIATGAYTVPATEPYRRPSRKFRIPEEKTI
jgi:hypothetical protein